MPEIKRIVITKGGKVNLGDYQNADRSVTVEADLLPGENEFEAFDYVSEKAREYLALEIRELVENQLSAADLLGNDAETIRHRVRYAKGFAYLHSVDPEAADILITDMVSDLASKEAPEPAFRKIDHEPDDDDDFGDDDDEGPSDAFPRDDDAEDAASDLFDNEDTGEVVTFQEGTDIPNSGLN